MELLSSYLTIVSITLGRYLLLAGIPFLIFYVLFFKRLQPSKIQDRWAQNKDFIREVVYSIQTTLLIGLTGFVVLKSPLKAYTQFYTDLDAYPIWWFPVSVVLALILHDTYFYWMHRTVHHPKLYRYIHLVHHKSANPSPLASYAFNASEALLEGMIAPILLFVLPLHPLALLSFIVIAFIINVYGHLGFEIAPKWLRKTWLFELINTSVHHNLHHKQLNGNYGLYFRYWDRLMGTEHPDYVEVYDALQAKRFAPKTTTETESKAKETALRHPSST